jgi:hypothetical protein
MISAASAACISWSLFAIAKRWEVKKKKRAPSIKPDARPHDTRKFPVLLDQVVESVAAFGFSSFEFGRAVVGR